MVAHTFKRHTISFKHAFDGLKTAFYNQPNFRFHCLIGLLVVLVGWYLELSSTEWLVILFTIMWVMLAEMMNTVIESVVDLITSEYHQQAKIAKDVAAGTVLMSAIASVVVGMVIFLPKIMRLIGLS